eukprot:TRINITY_DN2430_c0_g1_i14.p1 TRINITY_DN2430_c0_g1~~TRINITY_DN2430_c0_g1_i14.p1  ORF type:complete len:771 (-),score=170.25 TRINITY_DN2430_c0_g1_i14:295-2607(-)
MRMRGGTAMKRITWCREAKRMGAQIAENTGVAGFEHDEQGKIVAVITECGQRVATNRVVNAAGCWAGDVAAKAGVAPLPIVAMKHAMIVTDGVEGMHSGLPNVRDHDLSIYIKTQGDSMALGGYEKNPAFWADVDDNFSFGLFDLDFDTFQQNLEGHLVRCPASAEAGVKSTVCGPESFTPDHQPLLGPDPSLNGLWHCSGFNSMGMMLGGGVGAEMATWMLEGAPSKDLFSMDIARFHPDCTAHRDWVLRSSHESYAKTYAVVFPHDEHLAGRGVRKSPLYDQLLQAGCIFQGRHGFERPGWFSNQQGVEAQEYDWYGAYHEQGEVTGLDIPAPSLRTAHQYKDMVEGECTFNWRASFDAVSREVHAARNGVAVFDQSYFGKFLLTGPDAAAAADWMATAPVGGREVGAVVYTALCNQRGGVQADLTIARDAQDQFYISSGGSTATQDSRWMRSVLHQQGLEACLTDVSDQFAIMSIQGPYSRELLQTMSTPEGSGLLEELPFSHCGEVGFELEKGAVPIRCMRLTFVGELGFELHVPSQLAGEVYSKLMSQGQTLEARLGVPVANAGYHCIDSLSAEKGYRHWHADLSNTDTPMEAGIGFVASNKIKNGPDFLGREALAASKAAGLQRKLVCLTVDAQNPAATGEWELPLNGNETIWRDDVCVGFVRSTAYGHTIGRSVAYGYASLAPDSDTPKITNQWLESGTWHIGSLGQKLPAKLHLKAPFDPTNQRVKGVYEQQPPPESQIRALLDPVRCNMVGLQSSINTTKT